MPNLVFVSTDEVRLEISEEKEDDVLETSSASTFNTKSSKSSVRDSIRDGLGVEILEQTTKRKL